MSNQIFYISGKISGVKNLNKEKFEFTESRIRFIYGVDTIVFNPHNLPVNHDGSWHGYMRTCIRYLTRANVVVLLDDWQDSRGAIIEVLLAGAMAIPVIRLAQYTSVDVNLSLWLKLKLVFKLLLNRFANAKDYQSKS